MSAVHPHDVSPGIKFDSPSPDVPLIFALPFDIECAILGQLSDDFGTLQACSLVCHGWRSITLQHLFRSVCVNLERPIPGPTRVPGKNYVDPKQLQRFLDFLDARPEVATFVLNVRVRGGWGALSSFGGFIPAMLMKAPRLRALALSSLSLGYRRLRKSPSVLPPSQVDGPLPRVAIDTLDISRCEIRGTGHLLDILRHFSRIRQLNVYRSEVRPRTQSLAVLDELRPSTVPVIENVMLAFPMSSFLLSFLLSALRLSSPPNGALKAIRCRAFEYTLREFLVPCLKDACGHLRELHLDVDGSCNIASEQRKRFLVTDSTELPYADARLVVSLLSLWRALRPCLASCTALESITVAIERGRGEHGVHRSCVAALQIAFSIYRCLLVRLPPSVRSITFRVRGSFEPDAVEGVVDAIAGEGNFWGKWDTALCSHPTLARFAFEFENADGDGPMAGEDWARITDTLEGVLPNLLAKGVLGVELTAPENPRWVYPI